MSRDPRCTCVDAYLPRPSGPTYRQLDSGEVVRMPESGAAAIFDACPVHRSEPTTYEPPHRTPGWRRKLIEALGGVCVEDAW